MNATCRRRRRNGFSLTLTLGIPLLFLVWLGAEVPGVSRILFRATVALGRGTVAQAGDHRDSAGPGDAAEIAVHGTGADPVDTDGDGQGDSAEVIAGTDPLLRASVFRVLNPATRVAGGWRISWTTVPGKTYQLQRWNADDLALSGAPRWLNIATVTATGPVSSADDLEANAVRKRFYRVALIEAGPAAGVPTVSAVTANPASALTEGMVLLTATAQAQADIVAVEFFDGTMRLGSATWLPASDGV